MATRTWSPREQRLRRHVAAHAQLLGEAKALREAAADLADAVAKMDVYALSPRHLRDLLARVVKAKATLRKLLHGLARPEGDAE